MGLRESQVWAARRPHWVLVGEAGGRVLRVRSSLEKRRSGGPRWLFVCYRHEGRFSLLQPVVSTGITSISAPALRPQGVTHPGLVWALALGPGTDWGLSGQVPSTFRGSSDLT